VVTAAQLSQRRRITQAAARRRPRKLPPAQQPTGATLALTAPLLAIARDIDAAVNEALAAEGLDVLRTDAADGDLPPINRRGLLARLARLAARIVQRRGSFLDDTLQKVGDAVSAFSKSQWQAQAKAAMGVDLSVIEPDLAPAIKAFRQSHVDLIKTMTESKVERVRAILEDAGSGTRVETIRNRLMEDEGVSKRQASLIARDQTLALNSRITSLRHQAAGITEFIWRTSGDASVRPTHRKLEGKRFKYGEPPVSEKDGSRGRPGEKWQCRCTMEPVIEGLDDEPVPPR
jgi:SPP1 gp7 family putative phage head morphogenesis protein